MWTFVIQNPSFLQLCRPGLLCPSGQWDIERRSNETILGSAIRWSWSSAPAGPTPRGKASDGKLHLKSLDQNSNIASRKYLFFLASQLRWSLVCQFSPSSFPFHSPFSRKKAEWHRSALEGAEEDWHWKKGRSTSSNCLGQSLPITTNWGFPLASSQTKDN